MRIRNLLDVEDRARGNSRIISRGTPSPRRFSEHISASTFSGSDNSSALPGLPGLVVKSMSEESKVPVRSLSYCVF